MNVALQQQLLAEVQAVGQEPLQTDIGERVFHELHEHLVGHRADVAAGQGVVEGVVIDHTAAGGIDKQGLRFHQRQLPLSNQILSILRQRTMEA